MTRAEADRLFALAREAQLTGPEAARWVERLGTEREQLIRAASFFVENGAPEQAVVLAARVWRLWLVLGDVAEGRRMMSAALDGTPEPAPSADRAAALYGDGVLAFRMGALEDCRARSQRSLDVARALGDRLAEANALVGLSRVAFREGDYARVRDLARQARELVSDADPSARLMPLHMQAAGTRLAGDYDGAALLYRESLDLFQRLGDKGGVAMELHNLGHVELHRGNQAEAERCFRGCDENRDSSNAYLSAMGHLNRAALAFAGGRTVEARASLDRCRSTLAGAGIVLDPDDGFEVTWLEERLG